MNSGEDLAWIAGTSTLSCHEARRERAEISLPRPFDDTVGERRDRDDAEKRGEPQEIGGVAVRQDEHVGEGARPMQRNFIHQLMAEMMPAEPAEIERGAEEE